MNMKVNLPGYSSTMTTRPSNERPRSDSSTVDDDDSGSAVAVAVVDQIDEVAEGGRARCGTAP